MPLVMPHIAAMKIQVTVTGSEYDSILIMSNEQEGQGRTYFI